MLGVFAAWRGDEDVRSAKGLNTMVLDYALPMILFASMVTTSRAALASQRPLALSLLVGLLVPSAIVFPVARYLAGRDLAASALQTLAAGIPAAAFSGIPILTPLIGDRVFTVVAWSTLIDNTIILPAVLTLLALSDTDQSEGRSVRAIVGTAMLQTFRKPIVWAPLAGIAFVLSGIKVPADIVAAFKLLGGTVGGASLFASGIILQAQTISVSWPALATTAIRVAAIPALAYLALTGLHVDNTLRAMVVLLLAMPASPMQVMFSVTYGQHEKENAALLLYSNVLSLPTLATFIWLVTPVG